MSKQKKPTTPATPATPTFGPNRNQITKIKFLPKHSNQEFLQNLLQYESPPKTRNLIQLQNSGIQAWNTNAYSRQEDVKGIRRLLESNKLNKRKIKDKSNLHFVNRAALTTRSWNAERERLMNLRKEMHMGSPVFQPQTSQDSRKNVLGLFKRLNQQTEQNSQQQLTPLKKLFVKHHHLLSRIYSHSCQPKIIINNIRKDNETSSHQSFKPKFGPPTAAGVKFNKIFSLSCQKESTSKDIFYNFQSNSRQKFQKYSEKEKNQGKNKIIGGSSMKKIGSVGDGVRRKKQLVII